MIKYFRKIRQNLLLENRTGKYFKYAIGEIVLVVIGILIALQINNWNEENKLEKEEQKLLVSLNDDFQENQLRILQTISKQEGVIKYSKDLISAMTSRSEEIAAHSIGKMVTNGAQSWYRAEYVTGTYDAILSSGNINILKNEDLKRNLAQFTSEVKSGFEDHEESMNYMYEFNKLAAPFSFVLMRQQVFDEFNIVISDSVLDEAVEEILSNKTYMGLLVDKTILENHRLMYQLKIQVYIDEILAIIASELEK